jgi:hypothetical protein
MAYGWEGEIGIAEATGDRAEASLTAIERCKASSVIQV